MKNKTKKPRCLRVREALVEIERGIATVANSHGLNYCDLEDILFRISTAVSQSANREREAALAEYQNAVKAAEKERIGGDGGGT